MTELIQKFSKINIQEHLEGYAIDLDAVKDSIAQSQNAIDGLGRFSQATYLDNFLNIFNNDKEKALQNAFRSLGNLSKQQLAFTMLGVELSLKTQSLQEEIDKKTSSVERVASKLLDRLSEQGDNVHKTLASLDDKNTTTLHRIDSIESMLMDVISADAALRDYKSINKVGELLKEAKLTHEKIKCAHNDVIVRLSAHLEKTELILKRKDNENISMIKEAEAGFNKGLKDLSEKLEKGISQELSSLWLKSCAQMDELNSSLQRVSFDIEERITGTKSDIAALGALAFDRIGKLDSAIQNTDQGLTKLILHKKEESDLALRRGLEQLDASRKHMGHVLLSKMEKHAKALNESDSLLDSRITENSLRLTQNTLALASESNAIKAELARVQKWAKLMTIFAAVSMGWIIYTTFMH